MPNPTSPTDANGYRLGMMVHKVSTTLVACIWRAIGKASTSGATDVAWGGIATHLEDEVAVVADASNAKPVVLIAGQVGTHVTVGTGDVSALQADALGALRINAGTGTAAALADATANPTTTHVAADLMSFNGTTWDRLRIPLGAALADGYANPTTVHLASDTMTWNGTTWDRLRIPLGAALADATANPTTVQISADQMAFNGTTWDRQRNNTEGTIFTSTARTATHSSADQTNYNARGVILFINVTASVDTPSVTFAIEYKDPVSAVYWAPLTSAAIVGAGHTVIRLGPGITAAANVAASEMLPRTWRVTATHADADSITYTVGYALVV